MPAIDILEEAAAKLPHSSRKMFGGHGLFAANGGMFAGIVDDDRIVIKFVRTTSDYDAFTTAGGKPWVYKGKMGSGATMQEWLLPPDAMYDDLSVLSGWLARAHKGAPAKGTKAKPAKKTAARRAPAKRSAKSPKKNR